MMKQSNKAFSLIELSIVLAVIGLIAGGVLAAQTMIKQAKLMSIGADAERYRQATAAFQNQYKQLPGDFSGATTLWGTDSACPAAYNTVPKAATCNGDGNDRIAGNDEIFRYWQHLANAKLLEGAFTGAQGSGAATYATGGLNVPQVKYDPGTLVLYYLGIQSGSATFYDDNYGHIFQLGAGMDSSFVSTLLITTKEAKALDTKFDDTSPRTGTIKSRKRSIPANNYCVNVGDTDYDTLSTTYCSLLISSGF